MSSMSQSMDDNNFWPVTALTPTTLQWCVSIWSNSRICKEKYVQLHGCAQHTLWDIRLWFPLRIMLPVHLVYSQELIRWLQPVVPLATASSIQIYSWPDVTYQHYQLPTRDHPYTQNNFASMIAAIFDLQHPKNLMCNHDVRVCLYWIQESVQSCQCFRHSNVWVS